MEKLEISEERRKWNGQEILARYGFPTDIPIRAHLEDGLWGGDEGNWVALIEKGNVKKFALLSGDGDDYALGCAVSFYEGGDMPAERIQDIVEAAAVGEAMSRMLGEVFARGQYERE